MQSCNNEETDSTLSEEDKIAEMFKQAGFQVEKLDKPVNASMTKEEAFILLKAYNNRQRSGSIKIPASNIEENTDGSLSIKIDQNSGQKKTPRTRTDSTEEFDFSHWTEITKREIHVKCHQEKYGANCWRSDGVSCDPVLTNPLYKRDPPVIDDDYGYSPNSLDFKIKVHIYLNSGWYSYSFDEIYEYCLMLTKSTLTGEWFGSLSWEEVSW